MPTHNQSRAVTRSERHGDICSGRARGKQIVFIFEKQSRENVSRNEGEGKLIITLALKFRLWTWADFRSSSHING
ncbi:hypothetical protein CEXT_293931 [Caerostris extrusa]|uniref:Ycf15 n=1 Tax=Caerostris extrusa TaxID=172846 RepID=A0AAV4M7D2_CAEEX|nr:hypothetical protein CEXT_293931 [Caerostris extrusa]